MTQGVPSVNARLCECGRKLGARNITGICQYCANDVPTEFGYDRAFERDSVEATKALGEAIGAAVMRFASANSMSIEEAQALLIGSEPLRRSNVLRIRPPIDNTGHRPREVVPRPIGEIILPIVAGMEISD